MDVVIRPARRRDTAALNDVERDGDRRYAGYDGIPAGFDDVVPVATLDRAVVEDRLWVAAGTEGPGSPSHDGAIVGFALVEVVDGQAHLAQLSVRRDFQGVGLGRRLVEAVKGWARERSMTAVTLCTFSDVAWNRPLYEHLGFRVLPPAQWTPGVAACFEAAADIGLDLRRRCVMQLDPSR